MPTKTKFNDNSELFYRASRESAEALGGGRVAMPLGSIPTIPKELSYRVRVAPHPAPYTGKAWIG